MTHLHHGIPSGRYFRGIRLHCRASSHFDRRASACASPHSSLACAVIRFTYRILVRPCAENSNALERAQMASKVKRSGKNDR